MVFQMNANKATNAHFGIILEEEPKYKEQKEWLGTLVDLAKVPKIFPQFRTCQQTNASLNRSMLLT
jgi:hypothetical protein